MSDRPTWTKEFRVLNCPSIIEKCLEELFKGAFSLYNKKIQELKDKQEEYNLLNTTEYSGISCYEGCFKLVTDGNPNYYEYNILVPVKDFVEECRELSDMKNKLIKDIKFIVMYLSTKNPRNISDFRNKLPDKWVNFISELRSINRTKPYTKSANKAEEIIDYYLGLRILV